MASKRKRVSSKHSHKNVPVQKRKKNYLLNIVLIILFILVVIFILKAVFNNPVLKSEDASGSFSFFDGLPFLIQKVLNNLGFGPDRPAINCSNTEEGNDIDNACDTGEVCVGSSDACPQDDPFQTTCQECGSDSDCAAGQTCSGCSCS